jgi:hypothetical protein
MPRLAMNRRDFIKSTALTATAALSGCATTGPVDEGRIMTVTGPIRPRQLGRTLTVQRHLLV